MSFGAPGFLHIMIQVEDTPHEHMLLYLILLNNSTILHGLLNQILIGGPIGFLHLDYYIYCTINMVVSRHFLHVQGRLVMELSNIVLA